MSRRLVVEADGGSRGNPGPAAYGSLVRDAETRRLLATRAEYIGIASNNVAEYGGLVAGLHLAREIDPQARIEVRMDSKLVVEQMSGNWKIKHADMQRLAAEARAVVPPEQVRYTWIPREQNGDADRLANEALDDAAKGRSWRGSSVDGSGVDDDSVDSGPDDDARPDDEGATAGRTAGPPPDVGAATTVLLLRHGVTDYTLERRFSGRGGADLPLNAEGRLQAAAAAQAVAELGGVDVVICSPLLRTRQTAQAVVDRLSNDR
ncbi:MAG TPA: reverse transcriptase-like protein, partial [Actinomycetales bacterium]